MANLSNINNKFLVTTGGNVGIGTTSPDSKLDVTGGDITVNTTGIGFMNFKYSGNSIGSIQTDGLDIKINATSDLVLLPGSNVGIGTTSPSSKLHVVGEARVYTGSSLGYWGVDTGNSYVYLGTNTSNYSLSFQTSGSEKMRIDSSGGVSITPTTSTSFFYGADGTNSYINFETNNIDATVQLYAGYSSGGFFSIGTKNSVGTLAEKMRVTGDGNVGIGTTSPAKKLDIRTDNGVLIKGASGTTNAGLSFLPASGGREYAFSNDGSSFYIKDISADITRMYFHYNGNIGIGLTNPSEKLDVNGRIKWVTATGGDIYLFAGSKYYLDGGSNTYIIGESPDGDNIGFVTGGSTAMTIDENQRVGIGTTSPSYKLHVSGTGGTRMSITNTDTNWAALQIQATGNQADYIFFKDDTEERARIAALDSNDLVFYNTDSATERMRIDSSGNLGIGTTTPYARLNSYGAIISQSADNDPEVTLTNTGGFGVQSGGTIRVMQGFSRSGVAGDQIIFTYAATSWKSWSLDYTFASTQGVTQGIIGGYWNNSGGQTNVENIDSLQASVAVTHGGTGNQNNIITFTFNNPGTHINCSFVYTQSGGDGAPRGDRVTIETIDGTP